MKKKFDYWKFLAIFFIVLFVLENAFFFKALADSEKELEKEKECYYDFCNVYPEALYEDDVCFCYDYDILGDLYVAKTEYMK